VPHPGGASQWRRQHVPGKSVDAGIATADLCVPLAGSYGIILAKQVSLVIVRYPSHWGL